MRFGRRTSAYVRLYARKMRTTFRGEICRPISDRLSQNSRRFSEDLAVKKIDLIEKKDGYFTAMGIELTIHSLPISCEIVDLRVSCI